MMSAQIREDVALAALVSQELRAGFVAAGSGGGGGRRVSDFANSGAHRTKTRALQALLTVLQLLEEVRWGGGGAEVGCKNLPDSHNGVK